MKRIFLLSAACALLSLRAMALPTEAAPQPTHEATKVVSLYSDAYEQIIHIDFNANWGQATKFSEKQVYSDTYQWLQTFNYQGWQFDDAIAVDDMTHLHIDIWGETEGSVKFYLIYNKADNSGNAEQAYELKTEVGKWMSYDIELAVGYKDVNKSSIFQAKFDNGNNLKTFGIDNVYFYNNSTEKDTEKPTDLTAKLVETSFFSAVIEAQAKDNSGVVYFDILDGSQVLMTSMRFASGKPAKLRVPLELSDHTYNLTVRAKDSEGNLSDETQDIEVKTLAAPKAAPEPKHNLKNATGVFSDKYASANWILIGNWSQKTVTQTVFLDNNETYLFENFDYIGFEFNGYQYPLQEIGDKEYMHIDIYSPNIEELKLEISWAGGVTGVARLRGIQPNKWNSFDFNLLANFGTMNRMEVEQMYLGDPTTDSESPLFYMDNLYFWKDAKGNGLNLTLDEDEQIIGIYNLMGAEVGTATDALPQGVYVAKTNKGVKKFAVR